MAFGRGKFSGRRKKATVGFSKKKEVINNNKV